MRKHPTLFFWAATGLIVLALFHSSALPLILTPGDRPYGDDPLITRLKQVPPDFFESTGALQSWAEISTGYGGHIKAFQGKGDQEIMVAFRSFTSGIKSSAAAIYLRHVTGGWQLVLHRQPVHRDFIDVRREDDRLIFESREGGRILLEVPFIGLEPVVTIPVLREIDVLTRFRPGGKQPE